MSKRIQIPPEWWDYQNNPAYFVTYYGDIYHGRIVEDARFPDRFFIISNNQAVDYRNLKQEERTIENYCRLGWEIRDPIMIKLAFKAETLGVTAGSKDRTRYGNQTWKRMFVFGAGASANCVFGEELAGLKNSSMCPPLGPELFDKRFGEVLQFFKGASSSVSVFNDNGKDIEGSLEAEWDLIRNAYNPNVSIRHLNIQFYLYSLFSQISNHVIRFHSRDNLFGLFAHKLQKYLAGEPDERVALVSFNYDTILDHYIGDVFRHSFEQMDDYIDYNKRQVLLFKPHGSCNWGWPVTQRHHLRSTLGQFHEAVYEVGAEPWEINYSILGNMNEMVHKHAWGMEREVTENGLSRYTINKNRIEVISPNKEFYPALLMPYRDKDEFVMHYDHHHALKWFTGQFEELYLIGWKGNERVFNNLLKDHGNRLQKIVIVNPNEQENKEVSQSLSKFLDLNRYKVEVINTFEEFVRKEMDKILTN
jgi:hypothetical protein